MYMFSISTYFFLKGDFVSILQETESLVLPQGAACLQKLRRVRDKIEAGKRKVQGKNNVTIQASGAAAAPAVASSPATPTVSRCYPFPLSNWF